MRLVVMGVSGSGKSTVAADSAAQDAALAEAARACTEIDGAEAVVVGGGPLSGTAARLRRRFATPIIEPVPAAVRVRAARFVPADGTGSA